MELTSTVWSGWIGGGYQEKEGGKGLCPLWKGSDRDIRYESCMTKNYFFCQSGTKKLKGNTSLTLEYKKEQLPYPYIKVQYHYESFSQKLFNSWAYTRMTGFRLSWEIKNPQLELFTSEVGRGVHTPELLSVSNLTPHW